MVKRDINVGIRGQQLGMNRPQNIEWIQLSIIDGLKSW